MPEEHVPPGPSEVHTWRELSQSELAAALRHPLGVDLSGDVVGSLRTLSQRLWMASPDHQSPETFLDLASEHEARAVLTLLSAHQQQLDPWPTERLAELHLDTAYGVRWEATAVLVTGALSLGAVGEDVLGDPRGMLDTLLHVAFGVDDLTVLTRRGILAGIQEPWPPEPPGVDDWPPLRSGCLMDIRAAGERLALSVASGLRADATLPTVEVSGIRSLSPASGSSGDPVAILGSFPTGVRTVLFPRAGGGTSPATLSAWSTTRIDVLAPEPVGDGPVGLIDDSGTEQDTDATASIEFADTLSACLGRPLAPAAGRLSGVAPGGLGRPRPTVPTLPGNLNVFHGGPTLSGTSSASGAEPGPAITVTGRNMRPGDTVVVDGMPAPTTFIDADTLTFTPPAIAAGQRFLQIRRGYRRSNGQPFDVRATLTPTPPSGRITPGTEAELHGTGFGPTITATLDGAAAQLRVLDTHTLEVLVRRPPRMPLVSQRRGEPISIEVFDRGSSLGSTVITVDTFRIASFGDSIVWGQGLLPTEKFTMLTADALTARRGGTVAVFALDQFAHSGARIVPSTGDAAPAAPFPPGSFVGECPAPIPSITAQLAAWSSAALAPQATEIDLVIIDGGINDARVTTILDPFASDAALTAATTAACRVAMAALLRTVLATFPAASVVVTGYYPIVSDESEISILFPVIGGLGLLGGLVTPLVVGAAPIGFGPIGAAIIYGWVRQRLIDRSALFSAVANASLAQSIASLGPRVAHRVALAVPAFAPANSIFAPDPFLFGVGLSSAGLVPLDPVAGARAAACGAGSVTTTVASIGHPNPRGARAYADAIEAVLPRLGL